MSSTRAASSHQVATAQLRRRDDAQEGERLRARLLEEVADLPTGRVRGVGVDRIELEGGTLIWGDAQGIDAGRAGVKPSVRKLRWLGGRIEEEIKDRSPREIRLSEISV